PAWRRTRTPGAGPSRVIPGCARSTATSAFVNNAPGGPFHVAVREDRFTDQRQNGTGGGIRTRTPLRAWRFECHVYRQFHHPGTCFTKGAAGPDCTPIPPSVVPPAVQQRAPGAGGTGPQSRVSVRDTARSENSKSSEVVRSTHSSRSAASTAVTDLLLAAR